LNKCHTGRILIEWLAVGEMLCYFHSAAKKKAVAEQHHEEVTKYSVALTHSSYIYID